MSTRREMLELVDPELAALLDDEQTRQSKKLTLIPSENHASAAVLEATGSILTNKYSEGYPGKRYYEGQQIIDRIECLAIARAKRLFGAEHANVQPYSGSPANLAVCLAFLRPGDTLMGMALPMGGHLTHGWKVSVTGIWFRSVQYGVRKDTGRIDLDEVRDIAVREKPRIIFCGGTALPRIVDFAGFSDIAREVDAILVADIAHIAGLVAAGAHPSPVGHADVVSTTTHKTLRGPRGAMLMCGNAHAQAINRAVFPGLQGGPHNHTTAAIAACLQEASTSAFADYARQVITNATALAEGLLERGYVLVTGGTDNHLILMDLASTRVLAKSAAGALDRAGLVTNYNTVPFDPRRPLSPSGLRLGTPAVTTRGMKVGEMRLIAGWIDRAIRATAAGKDHVLDRIAVEVADLANGFPVPGIPTRL